MATLIRRNVSNIQIINLCVFAFVFLSEISELTSSESRRELKEKSKTFRSLQKASLEVTSKFQHLLLSY